MRIAFIVALFSFLLDQISKYWVVHVLNLKTIGFMPVWPPFLQFKMAWNYGINFGLFADGDGSQTWILIGLGLAVLLAVAIWLWRSPPGFWGFFAAGLIFGGALGNIVDRFVYGAVADFLNMSCCGIYNPYAFNIADISIFLGAVGLAFFSNSAKQQ